jgi:hypothetical protein
MTVTCTLCNGIINVVPLIGKNELENFAELLQAMRKHTFEQHKKQFEAAMKEALGKIAQIEGACMAMVSMGLFTSTEPEYSANMERGYEQASSLFEQFRPGKPKPMVA